ncbi:hypothetical protein OF001_U540003 [Pseudomonas sp. OF001]|nr:hypothetical protein OF001_U540003 [Pseudomonas sp. OF001]
MLTISIIKSGLGKLIEGLGI